MSFNSRVTHPGTAGGVTNLCIASGLLLEQVILNDVVWSLRPAVVMSCDPLSVAEACFAGGARNLFCKPFQSPSAPL